MNKQVGWLIREPDPGYKDSWLGILGRADDNQAPRFRSTNVAMVIEWFDGQLGRPVAFEETLCSELGYRAI